MRYKRLIGTALASTVGLLGLYFLVDFTTTSPVFNCSEKFLESKTLTDEFSVDYRYRTCGTLYGGPFLVVQLRKRYFFGLAHWNAELIEIEKASTLIRPKIGVQDQGISIDNVPASFHYSAQASAFGLAIKVLEE